MSQHTEHPIPLGGGVGVWEEVAGAESQEGESVRGHAYGKEEVRGRNGARGAARRGEVEVERCGAVRGLL